MRFDDCVEVVLEKEGGFVNHPEDPGRATNMGITQRTYEHFLQRTVSLQEMIDMPESHAKSIYKNMFWDEMKCYYLPIGLDLVVFDMGVNAGPRRAIKLLQAELSDIAVDGFIGPKTISKVNKYSERNGAEKLIRDYTAARIRYYEKLKHFDVFGRGWVNRSNDVMKISMESVKEYG